MTEKVSFDDLSKELQGFVMSTNFYTVDSDGYVYDPYYREYVTVGQIDDQKTYSEKGEL